MSEGEKVRRGKGVNMEELKVLVTNLIPTTPKQIEWICSTVERLTHKYPELKRKIDEWNEDDYKTKRVDELREILSFHIVIGKYSIFMGIGEIQRRKRREPI